MGNMGNEKMLDWNKKSFSSTIKWTDCMLEFNRHINFIVIS